MTTSCVTSAKPRISMRRTQRPSSRSARRKTPSTSEVVVTLCWPCEAVTTAPGTGSPAKRMRPVRTTAASTYPPRREPRRIARRILLPAVRRQGFHVIDHQEAPGSSRLVDLHPDLLLERGENRRRLRRARVGVAVFGRPDARCVLVGMELEANDEFVRDAGLIDHVAAERTGQPMREGFQLRSTPRPDSVRAVAQHQQRAARRLRRILIHAFAWLVLLAVAS